MTNKKIVEFGAKCKVMPGVNKKVSEQILKPEPVLTIDEKIENMSLNTANMFTEHANALNAISMWIAKQDAQVAKNGNVVNWAMKEMAKEARLAERKAAYNAKKSD